MGVWALVMRLRGSSLGAGADESRRETPVNVHAMVGGGLIAAIGMLGMVLPGGLPTTLRSDLSLAREVARGRDPRAVAALLHLLPGFKEPEAELLARLPSSTDAVIHVLNDEAAPERLSSLSGTRALLGILGGSKTPRAIEELKRWLSLEEAQPNSRAWAAVELAVAGDTTSAQEIARLMEEGGPRWDPFRPELRNALRSMGHGSQEVSGIERTSDRRILERLSSLDDARGLSAVLTLTKSDDPEDRAVVRQLFCSKERFNKLHDQPFSGPTNPLWDAIQPIVSDMLGEDDRTARERACQYLIGNRFVARKSSTELWNALEGYPCARLRQADYAGVAERIRESKKLPRPRPPLTDAPRCRAHPAQDDPRVTCRMDSFGKHCQPIDSIAMSQDGRYAVTAGFDAGWPDLWDVDAGERQDTIPSYTSRASFASQGERLVTFGDCSPARVYDVVTMDDVGAFGPCVEKTPSTADGTDQSMPCDGHAAAALSADGTQVAVGSQYICLWEVETHRLKWNVPGCEPFAKAWRLQSSLAYSADGKSLVLSCPGDVRWIDASTGHLDSRVSIASDLIVGSLMPLAIAGRRLVAASTTAPLAASAAAAADPRFRPQAKGESSLRVWDFDRSNELRHLILFEADRLPNHRDDLQLGRPSLAALAVSPDGKRALVGGNGLCLWNLEEEKRVRCLLEENVRVTAVAWSSVGVALSYDGGVTGAGTIRRWQPKDLGDLP
jgi:WD40 repeat protein